MKPLIQKAFLIGHVAMHATEKKDYQDKDAKAPYTKAQYQDFMNIKAERERKEKNLLPLYRNIGFTISLLIVIVAFNWNFPERTMVDLGQVDEVTEEIIEIPVSEQPPPPPPKVAEVYNLVEVPDTEEMEEIELALDVEVTEETAMEEVIVSVVEEVEEEVVEEIFSIVEVHPEPVGGFQAFNAYLAENLKYPRAATQLGVSGKVFVKFVVEKDGSLTDIQVVKGIGAGCDEEAVRVVSGAPKWNPGKQRGMPVRVQKTVPIYFVLKEL